MPAPTRTARMDTRGMAVDQRFVPGFCRYSNTNQGQIAGGDRLAGAADAVGQVGREGADVGDGLLWVLRLGEAADEGGADDDAVGEAGDLFRLGGVGHA